MYQGKRRRSNSAGAGGFVKSKTAQQKSFRYDSLIRLCWALETGLKSGRDWPSVLQWAATGDPDTKWKAYLKHFCEKLKKDSAEAVLTEERESFVAVEWKLFFEILLQANKGSRHLSQLFESFGALLRALQNIKKREASLLFIPKFQAWVALSIALSFTVMLPILSPELFPTFFGMGRSDLFCTGLSFLLLGVLILRWMCRKPERHLIPLMHTALFFYFMAVFIESGLDLASAWCRSVEKAGFSDDFRRKIFRAGLNVESMEEFLSSLQRTLETPWPEILNGLVWAKKSGMGLSSYLKFSAERESQRVLFLWEDEIRKLTMLTLVPLGLLIFPATLYLLVGPQLLELMSL